MDYPNLSPIIFEFGPFQVRWYGLMYVIGFIIAFAILRHRSRKGLLHLSDSDLNSLFVYLVLGLMIGARLIYVLAYDLTSYLESPLSVFAIWKGGLSFHGGALGIAVASFIFCRRHRLPFFELSDALALAATPGLFFGRLGNFINGELYGRPSNLPWAMVFPRDPLQIPRHPSQLYEAFSEGLGLFLILLLLQKILSAGNRYRYGHLTAAFLLGYGLIRFLLEFTRQPDAQLGFVVASFSMGQLLSLAMIFLGMMVLVISRFQKGHLP